MELHNSAVLSDAPWTIVKLDRVLNFYLLLYKLLKVFCFSYEILRVFLVHAVTQKYSIEARYSNNLK